MKNLSRTPIALSVLSIVLLYVCTSATRFTSKESLPANADLQGTWTYNEQKSKQTQNFRIAPLKLKIASEANGIAIERTIPGFNGGENMVSTDHLTFDGKESESTVYGTMKKKSTAAWSADGKQLIVNGSLMFDQNGTQTEFKSVEKFSLSEDGKTLTINYSSASFANLDGTFVYDKAN
jgi:hypothetical protein